MEAGVRGALLTMAERRKQPKSPSANDWTNKQWCSHTMEYYSGMKKEWSTDTCYSTNGPRKHDAKRRKPCPEGRLSCISTYLKVQSRQIYRDRK